MLRRTRLAPRTLFWQYGPDSAVREGDWKLVINGTAESGLFNLKTDLGERHDLSAQHPDVRKRMEGELAAWEKDVVPN